MGLTEYKGNLFVAKLTVEEFYDLDSQSIKKRGYNLQDIKMSPVSGGLAENTVSTPRLKSGDTYSVAQLFALVKQYDKDFKPNSNY